MAACGLLWRKATLLNLLGSIVAAGGPPVKSVFPEDERWIFKDGDFEAGLTSAGGGQNFDV